MTEALDAVPMSLEGYWRGRKTPDLEVTLASEQEMLIFAEPKSMDALIQTCRFRIDMLERELARRRINSTVPAGLGA